MAIANWDSALNDIEKRQKIIAVYNKFWKELYVVAFRRLQCEENAEDILQDLFLSLLEKDVVLDHEPSVRAFLHSRLKSRIIDYYRHQVVQAAYRQQHMATAEPAASCTDTQVLVRELDSVVRQEIDRLPTKMREIFLLSREESLSNEEIASRLDISGKTVRNQLSTALKKIRVTVQEHYSVNLDTMTICLLAVLSAFGLPT